MFRRSLRLVAFAVVAVVPRLALAADDVAPATAMPPESKPAVPLAPDAPSTLTTASTATTVTTTEAAPLAGWHGGVFYLRDPSDDFRLYVQGRGQIDSYNYFGPGVADGTLKSTVFLRRVRLELSGEVMEKWQWLIAGDFGSTALDNGRGTNETSAAAPGKTPDATTGRYAPAQSVALRALATDVFLNYKAHPLFQIQLGQYDAPFTMENRTSDKYFPFIERSLAVRVVGIPTNKEIGGMFWGETPDKLFFYSVGLFNGDGQGRLNPDNRGDAMGRVFVHPLAASKDAIKGLQIGASFRYGVRDSNYVNYDYNSATGGGGMTTQGNFTFWSPIYGGTKGPTHVIPAGKQAGLAGELRIPLDMVDLTSELVYISNGTREAVEGYQATNSERFGTMKGYSYYVQLGFWPIGNRDINGIPGYENPTHVDLKKADDRPKTALQLLIKWEQLNLEYKSADRSGDADANNIDGKIKVNAFSLGANYWATKHIRLSVNYVMNMFPGSAPVSATVKGTSPSQSSDQRAISPAQGLGKGINDDARDNGHMLHELIFRAAIAL